MEINFEQALETFQIPFFDLITKAHLVHKENPNSSKIQLNTLLSVQTGGCSEDCAYCAQSIRNKTKIPKQIITDVEIIVESAKKAKEIGSSRFCMGLSGRAPNSKMFEMICEAIRRVKSLGLETCVTMGTLSEEQVRKLKEAGLDFYNHNVDTSPEFYKNIITTRTIDERINTIQLLQKHDIKICSGGILGIGETNEDRIKMIVLLANLVPQPQCVPLNRLVKVPGTPLENAPEIDNFDFIRTIALARILLPKASLKLAAGRESMTDEMQAFCLFSGVDSIFVGEKLLTVDNSNYEKGLALINRLNLSVV